MRLKRTIVIAVLLAACVALAMLRTRSESVSDEIEYHGEKFRLTKAYGDYDDYKDDPNNLAPGQEARIEQAVAGATLERAYASRAAMSKAVFKLKVPGYGMGQFGEKTQADGSALAGFMIEIPRTGKNRFVVFRGRDGTYTLVDDFVEGETTAIMQVNDQDGKLVYSTTLGKPLFTRTPAAPQSPE
jgi:hypothetical protein